MTTYRCPDKPYAGDPPGTSVIGCGATFDAEPDDEGLVDCPHCGIWFSPSHEANRGDQP